MYEILKDKNKREIYDRVLEDGLPDWRMPGMGSLVELIGFEIGFEPDLITFDRIYDGIMDKFPKI